MIWIHGGSWASGFSNLYPADVIAATQDVIVVTINYRLNAFGFMSAQDPSLIGNYGMWDQRLAIEWVKDNIADYGGDPNKITLFGESAGAFCITYHMISHKNDVTLFQRAITESGSAFSRSFSASDPLPTFHSVANASGCNASHDVIACLKGLSANKLVEATKPSKDGVVLKFFPTVDDDYIPANFAEELSKFTKASYNQNLDIDMADFAKYDVFSGWNDQEGLLLLQALNVTSTIIDKKGIENGISEKVFSAAIEEKLAEGGVTDPEIKQFASDLAISFYINDPYPMTSDGRSADDRRLEAFVNLAGT